ncbi:MAG TPA: thiamine-phosphate kinase [Dissulfurispiraceae bacterium]|nr:thiamine-phosphate kinase [Dissulfurispiraceae bacterium]
MRLFQTGELKLLREVRERFRLDPKDKGVVVGIGDDAAVIAPQCNKKIIITTDMMNEGVHFDLDFTSPFQLGFKLVSVNVSDVMAMGGIARYLFLDLAFTLDTDNEFFAKFYDGVGSAMSLYGIQLLGGDLCSARGDTVLSATVMGEGEKIVTRAGASPGDKIYLTASTGDSACGLEILRRLDYTGREKVRKLVWASGDGPQVDFCEALSLKAADGIQSVEWKIAEPLLRRHLMPVARDSRSIVPHASSMLDVSDGLFIDLCRICDESCVGAVVYRDQIPISAELGEAATLLGQDAFYCAASGGEDYELLFTSHDFPLDEYNREHDVKVSFIGEITGGDRSVVDSSGNRTPLRAEGYQHFGPPG